jgi:hypothetical protein
MQVAEMHISDRDGYLRISADRPHPVRDTLTPGSELGLLFIDIQDDSTEARYLSRAIQNSALARVRYMLFRWPALGVAESAEDKASEIEELTAWLADITQHESIKLFFPHYVGVIKFNIGDAPTIVWHVSSPSETVARHLIDRALRVEFRALLNWGHGIWRPKRYHYVLPSGTHSDVFVKVADAFRTPRDVHAMATWLTDRLHDDMAIIADTADLIPLAIQLRNFADKRLWRDIRIEVLDEYPRTRADLFQALRSGRKSGRALILFSVNSSGTYRDIMYDIAAATYRDVTVWSMVVLVDKMKPADQTGYYSTDNSEITTWYGLSIPPIATPHSATECELCSHPEKSQVVLIDPRTFEAVALPGANLIMPDVGSAKSTRRFWTACYASSSVEVLSYPAQSPSIAAREKEAVMNVKINTERLWSATEFLQNLKAHLQVLPRDTAAKAMRLCDCIVVSTYDRQLPNFTEAVNILREYLELRSVPIIAIDNLGRPEQQLSTYLQPLLLGAGSVTGWNIRQLLSTVQESWQSQPVAGSPHCLVVHARPTTVRQWENLASSFERRIFAVWTSYIPEQSPLGDEAVLLSRSKGSVRGEEATAYADRRLTVCQATTDWASRLKRVIDGAPDPRAVLWGLTGESTERVRNESLYGTRVDAITAYAAVGSAMQAARQQSDRTDPRCPMFDFDSISRSYFDGIIVASILRWAKPGESWWGSNARDQRVAITSLVKRTTNLHDQVVLFPELLLAAAQGKVPGSAAADMVALIDAIVDEWQGGIDRAPIMLGKELLRIQSL